MSLPNHNCYPDAMHTIKDAIERIFSLLISRSIELAEAANGRFGFKKSSSRKRKREGSTGTLEHPGWQIYAQKLLLHQTVTFILEVFSIGLWKEVSIMLQSYFCFDCFDYYCTF